MRIALPGVILLLLSVFGTGIRAQAPTVLRFQLSDGTQLTTVRQSRLDATGLTYHYLPANMRISKVKEQPEFSFLAFRPDSLSPVSGAVMHMLLVWGLDAQQMSEAESLLIAQTDSSAFLAGSVFMEPDSAHPEPEIAADSNELAVVLQRSLKSSAKTPLNAGAKTALSFQFNAADAERMEKALQDPGAFKGIKFVMYFNFNNNIFGGQIVPADLRLEGDFEQWVRQL